MLAVYAVVGANAAGWGSPRTLGLLGAAAALGAGFVALEARVREPLMPLALFRLRNVVTADVVAVLWAAAMFAWFFLSALYLQQVLGYGALQVGRAFLPANLVMAACSLGVSARIVLRFGIRWPLAAGLLCAAAGLLWFARAPLDGAFGPDVLPGMLLLGLGAGVALNPLLLAAISEVDPADAGLASGVVNTAFMMGGALGLAVLASLAGARTEALQDAGAGAVAGLAGGYRTAFAAGAACAAVAALAAAAFLRTDAATGGERAARGTAAPGGAVP